MDPRALEQAILDAIVECLAERVVERLQARRKVALALFTGTQLGASEAVESLGALRDEGWTVRFVFSETARQTGFPESLNGLGGNFGIDVSSAEPAVASGNFNEDALLDGCSVLLVPALSINSAAKVATGVRDSVPSRLMARALERGMAVVAASDGCCPDNPQRIDQGFHVADAYKERMRANLDALQRYGVRLERAEKLAHAVRKLDMAGAAPVYGPASKQLQHVVSPVLPAVPAADMEAGATAGKRVFSRSDAVQCRESVLRLGRNVLVTSLAADELRVRSIQLIRT